MYAKNFIFFCSVSLIPIIQRSLFIVNTFGPSQGLHLVYFVFAGSAKCMTLDDLDLDVAHFDLVNETLKSCCWVCTKCQKCKCQICVIQEKLDLEMGNGLKVNNVNEHRCFCVCFCTTLCFKNLTRKNYKEYKH